MHNRFIFLFTMFLAAASSGSASAAVFVITEFQGIPRNAPSSPTKQMPLWESGAAYLFSDGGPILSAEFSGTSPGGYIRGIFGRMGQRWESSAGNGVYDVSSPGPINIVNAQSNLSLDSHFLPLTIPGAVYTDLPTEGQIQFPGLNPIPSTDAVGYGSGFPPGMGLQFQGFLKGSFVLPASAQSTWLPFAYLTLGGSLAFSADVTTTDGTFRVAQFLLHPDVPEPAAISVMFSCFLITSRRSRKLF